MKHTKNKTATAPCLEHTKPKTKEEHARDNIPANCEINMGLVKFSLKSASLATAGVTGDMI